MSMPGGRSYEIAVVKVDHAKCAQPEELVPVTVMDDDIRNGLEVICDHAIYKEYLGQLGIVTVRPICFWVSLRTRRRGER